MRIQYIFFLLLLLLWTLLPFWNIGLISQFLDYFTDGRTPWAGDQLVARPLPKHRTIQTQTNAHTYQTSMPWAGFDPTMPTCERAKTVHGLHPSATVSCRVQYGLNLSTSISFSRKRLLSAHCVLSQSFLYYTSQFVFKTVTLFSKI
jgi:hypothetical protein